MGGIPGLGYEVVARSCRKRVMTLLRDHDVMTCQAFMSESDDRSLESELRKANWLPSRDANLQPSG
jgi:hypothetical protein